MGKRAEESVWDSEPGWAEPRGRWGRHFSTSESACGAGLAGPGAERGRSARDPGEGPGARGRARASPESGARSGAAPCPAQVRPPRPPQPEPRGGGGLSPRPRLFPLRRRRRRLRRRRLCAALRPDGQGCAGEWRSERAAAWAGGPRPRLPPPRSWGCTSRRRPISGESPRPPRPALQPGLICSGCRAAPHPGPQSPAPNTHTHRSREREGGVGMGSPPWTESPETPLSLKSRLIAAA